MIDLIDFFSIMRLHASSLSAKHHFQIKRSLSRWHACQNIFHHGTLQVAYLPQAMETLSIFSPSLYKVSDQFILIIGLPLKIHLKRNMTLELRKKAGLDKQMLQTIKYCQNALLHKAHLVISLGFASGFTI